MPKHHLGRPDSVDRTPAARGARVLAGFAVVMGLGALSACAPDYSPDVYAANAVQQAAKVEVGVVAGFRQVEIAANGTVGTVTGGAVGGILGSQTGKVGFNSAIGAVAGSALGGMLGNAIAHAAGDTTGWEYIVRKDDGGMLSVTQRQPTPIPVGQRVLVITGPQARVIPDYATAPPPHAASRTAATPTKPPVSPSIVPTAIIPAATRPTSLPQNDRATPPARTVLADARNGSAEDAAATEPA